MEPGQDEFRPDEALTGFRILRETGRGGMGSVYLAEDERLGRRFALKGDPARTRAPGWAASANAAGAWSSSARRARSTSANSRRSSKKSPPRCASSARTSHTSADGGSDHSAAARGRGEHSGRTPAPHRQSSRTIQALALGKCLNRSTIPANQCLNGPDEHSFTSLYPCELGTFSHHPSGIAPRRSAVRIRLAPSPKCPARRQLASLQGIRTASAIRSYFRQ